MKYNSVYVEYVGGNLHVDIRTESIQLSLKFYSVYFATNYNSTDSV